MEKALKDLDCNKAELSILFTSDDQIHDLNMQYLKRDKPTNVLAFPMITGTEAEPDSGMLGDIVISVDTAGKEAEEMGVTLHERIFQLLIHGILHLMGYDHEVSSEAERIMQKEEQRLLSLIMEEY